MGVRRMSDPCVTRVRGLSYLTDTMVTIVMSALVVYVSLSSDEVPLKGASAFRV